MKTVKIKPIEVSEIKDKKILREAIAQIHRKPTTEDLIYVKNLEDFAKRMIGQCAHG
ncbi:MAG: hypothetical protein LBL76_01080 [Treponema sp.]|jgi:hypothetical protein|nr:hypothetical protein [Treponema sp.]